MVIAEGVDVKVGICDIETMLELFDVGIYDPDTQEWYEFEVSAFKNELFEFVKYYTSKPCEYLVTFNGISFDQQVLEWVVDNHQSWIDLTNLEICQKISNFAGKIIEDQNYGLFLPYKDSSFRIKPIDIFRIHHLDNEAKLGKLGGMASLKWCEFMMNMDVEEMPVHHLKKNLTKEEVQMTKDYRRHDVLATYKLFQLTLGQDIGVPELADYVGKNRIEERLGYIAEVGLPCLNWSDVKIGEEWNKMEYLKAEKVSDERQIFPVKVKYPYGQKFKNFFPKTMKFQTKQLQEFVTKLGNQYVKNEKQEFPITIGSTTYTIAKGGIHSTERNRRLNIPEGWDAEDADVGAQYPNSCIKHGIYAPHLKKTILTNLITTAELKDEYKQRGKEEKDKKAKARLKGLEGATKLRMNGGYYGKMGQKGSFLEYPEGVLKVCMGNQIEILMLIEAMEVAGFKVVSGNTDGIVTLYPKDREEDYYKVCRDWEIAVGNNKMGKLEYSKFAGLWQENINSYIAKFADGKVKKKGAFVTVYGSPGCEINKNKSMRIVPLALEAYFIEGKDPAEFIRNHKVIYDFLIAKKATGKMHYEEQTDGNYEVTPEMLVKDGWKKNETGWYNWEKEPYDDSPIIGINLKEAGVIYRRSHPINIKVHKKLIVFYICTEGTVLYKRGLNNKGKPMNNHVNAPTELGQPKIKYFNRFFEADDYKIDYNHYILEVLERIDAIEKTKRAKAFVDSLSPRQQLTLF